LFAVSVATPDDIALLDRYMQAIGQTPLLDAETEAMLSEAVKRGDRGARDRMILANLRLVVKIAYDYAGMGVPLIDLISEGNLGLIKAVERFDSKRGGRLVTYAAWWIRQFVKKALADQSKMMRLPMHVVEKIAKLRRTNNELTEELKREPTNEELSKVLKISLKKVAELKALGKSSASLETAPPFSLPLEETLSDEKEKNPLGALLNKATGERLKEILSQMDEREALIIKLRHGLGGQKEMTLDEIGKEVGLTRERIRQLEQSAQVNLRRLLKNEDSALSKEEIAVIKRQRAKVEVLREFMIEKGLLK